MLKRLLMPEIQEMIEKKAWKELKESLALWPAPDIAELLEELKDEEMVILFRLLHKELASEVFSKLSGEKQLRNLKQMSNEHIREIILELPPDDRTELFEELPGEVTRRLINLLPPDERKEALNLLGYPEDSVGRLITPEYVAIHPQLTINEAVEHIRRYGQDAETINMVYVIDEKGHLIDDLPLRRLILGDPQNKVESIMDHEFVSIPVLENQAKAIELMKRYDLIALPVVDSENVLIGIVTVDDILDVLEEEVTEDFQKGAGVFPLEISYTTASSWTLFRKRITWLLLLGVAGFLSGSVIASFEKILGAMIALAFFIPVLIDTGGNTATQSATLVIRAIATGELTLRRWFHTIKKELFVGPLLGVALGIVLYLYSYLWQEVPKISLVVGLSVMIITIWANLIGSLLPIVLTRLRMDPAVISSPLLTTVLDVTGLLIYFSIAILLL